MNVIIEENKKWRFMSNFNTQCSLSHQTIKEGDECVLMLVRPAKGESIQGMIGDTYVEGIGSLLNVSEPDSFWTPQSLLLHVKYEGNGYFNLIDKENTYMNAYNVISDFFNEQLTLEAFDEDEEEDAMIFNFEKMLEKYCPGLYLEFSVKENLELSKEEVMNELNTAFSYLQTYSRIGRLFYPVDDMRGLVNIFPSPIHTPAYEYLLKKVENFQRDDGYYNDIDGKVESLLEDVERSVAMKTFESVNAVNHLHTSMPTGEVKTFNIVTKHLVENKIVLTFEHAKNLFGRYFEMSSLLEAMETMNLKINPQIYTADEDDNTMGQEFVNFTQHVSESLSEKRKLKI